MGRGGEAEVPWQAWPSPTTLPKAAAQRPHVPSLSSPVLLYFLHSLSPTECVLFFLFVYWLLIRSQPWTLRPVGAEISSVFLTTLSPHTVPGMHRGFSKYRLHMSREFHQGFRIEII